MIHYPGEHELNTATSDA